MSEQALYHRLKLSCGHALDLVRLTDKLAEGVADLVYKARLQHAKLSDELRYAARPGGEGWLELKFVVGSWSAGYGSHVDIPWKSPAQPAFLAARARNGWRAGVLLRVGLTDSFYYWRAEGSVAWVERMQQSVALTSATWRSEGGLDASALIAVLTIDD
jgi:hypothetical protein